MKTISVNLPGVGMSFSLKLSDIDAAKLLLRIIVTPEEYELMIEDMYNGKGLEKLQGKWDKEVNEILKSRRQEIVAILKERAVPSGEANKVAQEIAAGIMWSENILHPILKRKDDTLYAFLLSKELAIYFPALEEEGYLICNYNHKVGRINLDSSDIGELISQLINQLFGGAIEPESTQAPTEPVSLPIQPDPEPLQPQSVVYTPGEEGLRIPYQKAEEKPIAVQQMFPSSVDTAIAYSNADDPFEV